MEIRPRFPINIQPYGSQLAACVAGSRFSCTRANTADAFFTQRADKFDNKMKSFSPPLASDGGRADKGGLAGDSPQRTAAFPPAGRLPLPVVLG